MKEEMPYGFNQLLVHPENEKRNAICVCEGKEKKLIPRRQNNKLGSSDSK